MWLWKMGGTVVKGSGGFGPFFVFRGLHPDFRAERRLSARKDPLSPQRGLTFSSRIEQCSGLTLRQGKRFSRSDHVRACRPGLLQGRTVPQQFLQPGFSPRTRPYRKGSNFFRKKRAIFDRSAWQTVIPTQVQGVDPAIVKAVHRDVLRFRDFGRRPLMGGSADPQGPIVARRSSTFLHEVCRCAQEVGV